ncbi:cysteine desulfurase /L-selenocysteine selenide-lyase (L-alanine-forming) [Jatrophihabitans sp. GAS493]|nr:family 2A encapsulin nanocompartment cargo protein cysteine desulfurase [Jatrophihabitans sp. GAS493]SOD72488.1 cysteine desulfurase /L-selenocysteine selenide-lyase (L-alanine-forming) [Jatrophihabitans sp. GAS493]
MPDGRPEGAPDGLPTGPSDPSGPSGPSGLPDLATLARMANELFATPPGGGAPSPSTLPAVSGQPSGHSSASSSGVAGVIPGDLRGLGPQVGPGDFGSAPQFSPPQGTYPGGGSSAGSTPSPAASPSIADLPSSLDDSPMGPAAVAPTSGLSVPPLTGVLPVVGSIPPVARPVLNQGSDYYFLAEAPPRPSFGVPNESELRSLLAASEAPPAVTPSGGLPRDASLSATRPPAGGAATPAGTGIDAAPSSDLAHYFLPTPGLKPAPGLAPDPHPAFDLHAVRRDFPILSERVNGKQLVWFDNAATTHKPRAVIDRLAYFYEHENSNIHRAAHELAARATDAYESARSTVARFIGAGSAEEIVFVRGTTEAINLVAQTWGRKNLGEGDEIIISHLEHHANIVPWQLLAAEKGFKIKVIPVDDDGQLLLGDYQRLLNERTKLVSVTQVSNALGTVTPTKEIVDLAHRAGALVLVDGAQSISHMRTDVQRLDADFFVFSGHKIYGPTGIGVLYGKSEVLEDMPPYQGGGNMIADVTLERSVFQPPPGRFEAGTGNIADAVGLGAALDYLSRLGIENVAAYEHDLLTYATGRMKEVAGLHLIGTAKEKASVLSFVLDGYSTVEVGDALSKEGIAVRSGHHCAQPILRRFGLEATVRPSLALYNTCAEVDLMIDVLHRLAGDQGRGRR